MGVRRAGSCKILQKIIEILFEVSPGDLSTNDIAERTGFHPGVVGAVLYRGSWAVRRRVVRINRNRRETRWAASDAGLIDHARRNSRCIRKAAELAAKGVAVSADSRGRVTLRCGSMTKIVHSD